jgi:large subunit ribosomal protein L24
MMQMKKNKTHVHTGDTVKVISGNHRGAEGKILRVIAGKDQVIIEGVRMIKKHLGRSQERTQGEIIEREGPIHISNVKLLEKVSSRGKEETKEKKVSKKNESSPAKKASKKEKDSSSLSFPKK